MCIYFIFQHSALAKMFSEKFKLPINNGKIFIDRKGDIFTLVINYLRNKQLPQTFINEKQKILFYDELNYWQLPVTPIHSFSNGTSLLTKLKSSFHFDKKNTSKPYEEYLFPYPNPETSCNIHITW